MLLTEHVGQLGESANELVKKWGNRGYRYGFPDYAAYGRPVRPMHYDESRVYTGVIGRKYLDAKTERYYAMFDPNQYLQPGMPGFGSAAIGATSQTTARAVVLTGVIGIGMALAIGAVALSRAGRERDPW